MKMIKLFKRIKRKIIRQIYYEDFDLREMAIGMNSFVDKENDLHIIILDYDSKDIEMILQDIDEIQAHFKLCDAEIIQTTNGYHVFFWYNHVPYSRLKMIINFSRCDIQFKQISNFYDHKTIRVAGKYKELDLKFYSWRKSKVKVTEIQEEIGKLKRMEYYSLMKLHNTLNKDSLK